jgi:hypothetical protein
VLVLNEALAGDVALSGEIYTSSKAFFKDIFRGNGGLL